MASDWMIEAMAELKPSNRVAFLALASPWLLALIVIFVALIVRVYKTKPSEDLNPIKIDTSTYLWRKGQVAYIRQSVLTFTQTIVSSCADFSSEQSLTSCE